MKKIICGLLLALTMMLTLTACGSFKCDMCGEEKSGKKYTKEVFGEEVVYCEDCNDGLEEVADMLS